MVIWKFFAIVGFVVGVSGYVSGLAINAAQNDQIRSLEHAVHALQHPHKK